MKRCSIEIYKKVVVPIRTMVVAMLVTTCVAIIWNPSPVISAAMVDAAKHEKSKKKKESSKKKRRKRRKAAKSSDAMATPSVEEAPFMAVDYDNPFQAIASLNLPLRVVNILNERYEEGAFAYIHMGGTYGRAFAESMTKSVVNAFFSCLLSIIFKLDLGKAEFSLAVFAIAIGSIFFTYSLAYFYSFYRGYIFFTDQGVLTIEEGTSNAVSHILYKDIESVYKKVFFLGQALQVNILCYDKCGQLYIYNIQVMSPDISEKAYPLMVSKINKKEAI